MRGIGRLSDRNSRSANSGWLAAGLGLAGIFGSCSAMAGVRTLENAAPCVQWAVGDLGSSLAAVHLTPDQANVIVLEPSMGSFKHPESFRLTIRAAAVTIQGSDEVGTMYGVQELAEQVRHCDASGNWVTVAKALHPTEQQPFVEFRADNPFCHAKPLLLNDVEMWKSYIDMLARSRYNILDLHGGFDLKSTGFPNLYPLLVHVPDYPNVGVEADQARNLKDFNAILDHARDRGIRVAFMNYAANVAGVPAEKLADYTAKAVTALLNQAPNLYMLGFRVGETGQKASFFKDAYLKGVADSNRRDIRLYTRSWLTSRDQLESIGSSRGGQFDIEIKYNGEQLGLPYHALQEGFGSYSYEGYLKLPAAYQIIWQIRANGTHRFWAWEDTAFVRRTVHTLKLGAARGFTLEPQIAYFDTHAATYYRSKEDKGVYRYIWEKYWMWYLAWGRLGYNPDLPEPTLRAAFADHYGAAGSLIYDAMQASGAIVPMALAYGFLGPDHRNHSPETETGYGKPKKGAVLEFARRPMDHSSFAGPEEWGRHAAQGKVDGRIGPGVVADLFEKAALDTRSMVAKVGEVGGADGEWLLLRTDLLASSYLGDYYAHRSLGVAHLSYALHSGSQADYDLAVNELGLSREAWKKLAETTDPVFAPLENPLRNQHHFEWASNLPFLDEVDAGAAELWADVKPVDGAKPLVLSDGPSDLGLKTVEVSRSLAGLKSGTLSLVVRLTRQAETAALRTFTVVLHYKALPSEEKWQVTDMAAHEGAFTAAVPLTDDGIMYYVEVRSGQAARNYPSALSETPYWMITPADLKQ